MLKESLISAALPSELRKSLRVWPTKEVAGQAVHIIVSETTAAMFLTDSDLILGTPHVVRLVDPLLEFRNGVVFLVSNDDFANNRDEIQLLLHSMKLKIFPVTNYNAATSAAERMRKLGSSLEGRRVAQSKEPQLDALCQIDHLNKKRALLLLDEFGSVKKLAVACERDPVNVKGIGPKVAASVAKFLSPAPN